MKTRVIISTLWLIFAILFFILAWLHWAESKQIIPEFKVTRVLGDGGDITKGGISIEQSFLDFANEFNKKYLADQNESNRKVNLYACYGYLLAGLTALVSLVFEWREYILVILAKFGFTGDKPKASKKNK